MRPTRLITIAAATAVAALALGSAPVSGQEPDPPPITVDPTSGRSGTRVTISGGGCTDGDAQTGVMIEIDYTGDDGELSSTLPWGVEADGTWAAEFSIRPDDPLGSYLLLATCYTDVSLDPPQLTPLFDYAPATFDVTDGPVVPSVLSLAVDPTSGPVGTTITVSGTDCPSGELQAMLLSAARLTNTTGIIDETRVDVTTSGAWSVELVVNDTMSFIPVGEADVEPGVAYVRATCFIDRVGDDSAARRLDSEPVEFVITPGGKAPTHDEPQPSPDLPGSRPQASPATPVVAEPSYTG